MNVNKRIYLIWLDDERIAPAIADYWAKSYDEAIEIFKNNEDKIFIVDFDHDLGKNKTGYDVAKYIVENNIPMIAYKVHSMNPIGRANIDQLLSHYGYNRIFIDFK